MQEYTYYEIHYKANASKDWFIWTMSHDLEKAKAAFKKFKELNQKAKIVEVQVRKKQLI